MKVEIFTIYDEKAKAYVQPYFAINRGVAVRMFANEVNRDGSQMRASAEDFTLFFVGSFDDANGTFVISSPELVVTALQVRVRES